MRRVWKMGCAAGLALALAGFAPQQPPKSKPKPPAKSGARQKPRADPASYVIGVGDVLDVDVWQSKEVSREVPVRPDGQISLPLAGQIQASGRTPEQLQARIASRLSRYMDHPAVTVIVEKVGSRYFSVLGNVLKPGRYSLQTPTWLLQALAEAGGFTPFADRGGILLLRMTSKGQLRYRINYNDIIHGNKPYENVRLKPGDTIVVP